MSYFMGGCEDVSISAYKSLKHFKDPCRKPSGKSSDSTAGSTARKQAASGGTQLKQHPIFKHPTQQVIQTRLEAARQQAAGGHHILSC